jgi:hypothetical protein
MARLSNGKPDALKLSGSGHIDFSEVAARVNTVSVSTRLLAMPFYEAEANQESQRLSYAFHKIARDTEGYSRPRSLNEFDDYCDQELYDLGNMSAIEWWLQDLQKTRFPKLSIMVFNVLSIPPMSGEAQRVFSRACRTILWYRAQLSAQTIEMLECMRSWYRNA